MEFNKKIMNLNNKKHNKKIFKMIIDIAMIVVIMFLMLYMIVGEALHEWFGTIMFILFIVHHILNFNWHRNLFRGRYNGYRVISLIINICIFCGMFVSMITGIIISKYLYSWVNIDGIVMNARKYHMLSAYWNFVLMSVHIGLHCNMMYNVIKHKFKHNMSDLFKNVFLWVLRISSFFLAVYGGYQFINENIWEYLTGNVQFAFFDFRVSVWIYLFRYMSIMICEVFIVYYLLKAFNYCSKKIKNQNIVQKRR